MIAKEFALYSFPDIAAKVMAVVAIPIATRVFTIEELGLLGLFVLAQLPLAIFSNIGFGLYVNSAWFQQGVDHKKVIGTAMAFSLFLRIASVAVIFPFYTLLSSYLLKDAAEFYEQFIYFLALAVLADFSVEIFKAWSVIDSKSKINALVLGGEALLRSLIYIALLVIGFDVNSVLLSFVLISLLFSGIRFFILYKFNGFSFSVHIIKDMFVFGYPLLARYWFNIIRNNMDKVFIINLFGLTGTALYNFSNAIFSIPAAVSANFKKVWLSRYFKKLPNVDVEEISRFWWLDFIFSIAIISCFYLLGEPFIAWFGNNMFNEAYNLILILFAGTAIGRLFSGSVDYVAYMGKTKLMFGATLLDSLMFGAALFFIAKYSLGIEYIIIAWTITRIIYVMVHWAYRYKKEHTVYIELRGMPYTLFVLVFIAIHFMFNINIKYFVLFGLLITLHNVIYTYKNELKSLKNELLKYLPVGS